MNGELLAGFEYLERERGISRDVLIEAVQNSILSAARKIAGPASNLSVDVDRETGTIKAYCDVVVAEEVKSEWMEISPSDAQRINPEATIGDTIHREIVAKEFGRIAAQTAKQVIIQRIREAEHKIMFNEYKNRAGDIITGVVRRYERGNVMLDLGKAEAILPSKEQCPRESYGMGRRLKVYVVEVKESTRGPEIVVSRSHPSLVSKLFELEVPEIGEGTVEIKAVARDAGYRTKIAVSSKAEKVDPVGACVGMRGARVKDVVRELNGERVDIVRWSKDMTEYITNAMSPAKVREVRLPREGAAEIIVDDDQFALAVGKKGQGVKLISTMTGLRVEIKKVSDAGREEKEAGVSVEQMEGLGKKTTDALIGAGYKTLGDLRKESPAALTKIPGVGEKTAEKIVRIAAQFRVGSPAPQPGQPVEPAGSGAPQEKTEEPEKVEKSEEKGEGQV